MKNLLIIGNTVLAFLLGLSLWGAFSGGDSEKLETVRKKSARKSENSAAAASSAVKFSVPSSDEAANVIVNKNVFDPQRTGGAVGRGAVTYTLVGFYRVGKTQGAIITAKGGRNTAKGSNKQYYRIGDTLPNGYALTAIENNQAVLMRGASRMTLDMAYASEGMNVRSNTRRTNVNPMQQMVNLMQQSIGMQQRQQMQQMNMMRMMRNNQSGSAPARGGSTNSRRR